MKVKKLLILLLLFNLISINLNAECLVGNCNSDYGIHKFKNGTWYEGFWFNGQPEGIGVKVHYDGNTQMGIWKNGVFIEEKDVRNELIEVRNSLSSFYNNTELTPNEIINSTVQGENENMVAATSADYNTRFRKESKNKSVPLWIMGVSVLLAIIASILGIINHSLRIRETND